MKIVFLRKWFRKLSIESLKMYDKREKQGDEKEKVDRFKKRLPGFSRELDKNLLDGYIRNIGSARFTSINFL